MDWDNVVDLLDIHKQPHDITEEDIVSKALPTTEHWKIFYDCYARYIGFSVRKFNVRKDEQGVEFQRHWVCSREGFREKKWLEMIDRKREPRPITRVGCLACLQVTLDKTRSCWVAVTFNGIHNHELASPSEGQFLRSHRVVPPTVLQQAKSMRDAGIRTMSILDFLACQVGGCQNLSFTKKDLYNKLSTERRVATETDCEGALGYLTCLAIKDEHFFCRFNIDEESRLHLLFWADGTSRRDYNLFGDVLAFDTTYRRNAYNRPLMMLDGVNNHYRTCVFAVALLPYETDETFCWVLEQFLVCMNNKSPKVVLTDGDHAMHASILQQFPNSIHRLCAWHLETNAGSNVPNGEFKIGFSRLMYQCYSEEEFDDQWRSLVQQQNLQNHEWSTALYQKKRSWAETFLHGNFFAGMRTTQRCESINSYMQRFFDSKHLLRDFVSHIDRGIQTLRHTELQDDYITRHTLSVIPPTDALKPYYEQVGAIFTRNLYNIIAKQISAQNAYSVTLVEYMPEYQLFTLSKFRHGCIRHTVKVTPSSQFNCTCLSFENDGIPCHHIFCVMKHLSIESLPLSLIRPC